MNETNRFMRTELLIGIEKLQKLKQATVMVVGLGAVGGYALEALARSGIGKLILVDFDSFDITNINRQILALSSTIGRKKTEVAQERVLEINPDCQTKVLDCFVSEENIELILASKPDFVVDAIDCLQSKCLLMKTLAEKKIPFISAMGAALKQDITHVRLSKLSKTEQCPMAKIIRSNLRKCGVNIEQIDCVFSAEACKNTTNSIQPNPDGGKNIIGSLPTIPAVFGLMMAHHAILKLTER